MDKMPAINLRYYENALSQREADQWVKDISIGGLEAKSTRKELKVFATLEWAIPTAIAVYLAKPYFDAFLTEAGKDHYNLLKSGFMQLVTKVFGSESERREKLRFSKVISICSQSNDIETIKFNIPEGLSIEEYEQLFDEFHSLMVSEFEVDSESRLARILSENKLPARTHYLEYLPDERVWTNIDMQAEAVKAHKNQNK